MGEKSDKVKSLWRRLSKSAQFHNVLMFLVFVAIAAVFWFIIALNDNVTETFRVKIHLQNVPDSITFINDPPSELHVTVRDKGTNILRSGVIKNPAIDINFPDHARDGIFRISHADLLNELKSDLGSAAQITASSVDSIRVYYTGEPGKRVPVVVNADVDAASGYIISGEPVSLTKMVSVYSYGNQVDTVNFVRTSRLLKRDLSQTSSFEVKLAPLAHVKIVPAAVRVQVPVEPLVHKEVLVPIEVENLPDDESLLLFPNRAAVSFYVPMSRFNDENFPVTVVADFNETRKTPGARISLRIADHAASLINVELTSDSVDYTLMRH